MPDPNSMKTRIDEEMAAAREERAQRGYQSGGGQGCFPSNALVLTLNGVKRISSMSFGDSVVSYNVRTKQIEVSTVLLRRDHKPEQLWKLRFKDDGDQVITTRSHSFLTERGWIKTKDLKEGDRLISTVSLSHKTFRVLRSTQETQESAPVHNLITSGNHTFIVNGVVVHNFTAFRKLRTWLYSALVDRVLESQWKLRSHRLDGDAANA